MKKTGVHMLATCVAALAAAVLMVPAAAASDLDQEQSLADARFSAVDMTDGTAALRQTFTAGRSGVLNRVSVSIGCCGDVHGAIGGTPPGAGLAFTLSGPIS